MIQFWFRYVLSALPVNLTTKTAPGGGGVLTPSRKISVLVLVSCLPGLQKFGAVTVTGFIMKFTPGFHHSNTGKEFPHTDRTCRATRLRGGSSWRVLVPRGCLVVLKRLSPSSVSPLMNLYTGVMSCW
jgi:hypothetical protein